MLKRLEKKWLVLHTFTAFGLLSAVAIVTIQRNDAWAQQGAPDPVVQSYAQLLGEANARVANLNGALTQANAKIAEMQKQIDAAKPKDAPK